MAGAVKNPWQASIIKRQHEKFRHPFVKTCRYWNNNKVQIWKMWQLLWVLLCKIDLHLTNKVLCRGRDNWFRRELQIHLHNPKDIDDQKCQKEYCEMHIFAGLNATYKTNKEGNLSAKHMTTNLIILGSSI